MIKSTRNQLHNIQNTAQGKTKKVLTVCSAGLLRSATLQNFLIKEYDTMFEIVEHILNGHLFLLVKL